MLSNVELVVFIALAYPMLASGSLSFGLFYAFAFIRQILLSYSTTCFMALLKRKENLVAHSRADDFIHYKKEVNHPVQRDFARPCQIDRLCWHYDHAKTLLKDVTLTISPGDKIAIVGPSGFGKSTFLKILSGLLPAEQGELKQLDQEPEPLTWNYLAERCYLSVAEGMLFNGTLKQNITLFNDDIPNEVCLRLLEPLELAEMVAELPHAARTRCF
jgi:ABC-type bacteriocin/lantibiotic exporter with double-glycine peptidase domain